MTRLGLLLIGLVLLAGLGARAQTPPVPFSLTISVKNAAVTVGSDVKVKIVLKNTSSSTIQVLDDKAPDLGEQLGYTPSVVDASGNPVPFTEYGRVFFKGDAVTFSSPVTVELNPGDTRENWVLLNKLFDLSKPGTYTIQVQRLAPGTSTAVKSNTLTLTINPASP